MNIEIEKATESDIDKVARLYDELNDYLAATTNFPGLQKGVYPTRADAEKGVANGSLFVAKTGGRIVGSIILNHNQEPAYKSAGWKTDAEDHDVFVIHTFAVHQDFQRSGIGKALLDFAVDYCKRQNAKSIRLDVYEKNAPAMRLYEKCGFEYIDTVDLGLRDFGLENFHLYEKRL